MTRIAVLLVTATVALAEGEPQSGRFEELQETEKATFSTVEHLRRAFREGQPRLQVPSDPRAVPQWRESAAGRLREVLGIEQHKPTPLNPRVYMLGQRKGYQLERVVFTSEQNVDVPGLLLVPDGVSASSPAPAVLCLHGNVPGAKEEVAGESKEPGTIDRFHDDYARQLALAGFVTFAIDMRDCGERRHQEDYTGPAGLDWRSVAAANALLLGRTYLGSCVFDSMRALDYLQSRPEVMPEAIGCTGFSMGGTLTAMLAVVERRVKVAGISGWFGKWRDRAATGNFLGMITYLPGFLKDLDVNLTVAAVAPTPLVMAYEHRDRIEEARAATEPVSRAYAGFGASDRLRIELVPGDHFYRSEIIVPWMTERLKKLAVPSQ